MQNEVKVTMFPPHYGDFITQCNSLPTNTNVFPDLYHPDFMKNTGNIVPMTHDYLMTTLVQNTPPISQGGDRLATSLSAWEAALPPLFSEAFSFYSGVIQRGIAANKIILDTKKNEHKNIREQTSKNIVIEALQELAYAPDKTGKRNWKVGVGDRIIFHQIGRVLMNIFDYSRYSKYKLRIVDEKQGKRLLYNIVTEIQSRVLRDEAPLSESELERNIQTHGIQEEFLDRGPHKGRGIYSRQPDPGQEPQKYNTKH